MRLVFDRGTLLLLNPPPAANPRGLPGALWDSRVGAFRCPAHVMERLSAALASAGVSFSDEVSSGRLERPNFGQSASGPVTLRPYQQAALTAWQLAGQRGMVVLPTGSGKTRLALGAIVETGVAALCLVPTRVLLDQWVRSIKEHTGLSPGIFGDGERTLAPLTVATFESAWRHMDRIGHRFGLLVVDEAHHFGSGVRDEALEMCTADRRLGLTATPPREAAGERLATLVGPVVYKLSVSDLAGTFLAPFDNVVIHVDLDPAERAEHDGLTRTFREVMTRFLPIQPRRPLGGICPGGWPNRRRTPGDRRLPSRPQPARLPGGEADRARPLARPPPAVAYAHIRGRQRDCLRRRPREPRHAAHL